MLPVRILLVHSIAKKPHVTETNMKTKFCFLILFCSLLSACRFVRYRNANGDYRPKSEKFFTYKDPDFHLQETSLIDTNAIYVIQLGKMYGFDTNDILIDSIGNAVQYLGCMLNTVTP